MAGQLRLHANLGSTLSSFIKIRSVHFSLILKIIFSQIIVKRNMIEESGQAVASLEKQRQGGGIAGIGMDADFL